MSQDLSKRVIVHGLAKSGHRSALIVCFQGMLIVCMVRNTSFPCYFIQIMLLGLHKGVIETIFS